MSIVSKAIASTRANARKTATQMVRVRSTLTRIVNQMVKKGIEPHVCFDSYCTNLTFNGTAEDLNTFFKIMRSEGFTPRERPSEVQTSFSTSWTRGEDEDKLRIWTCFYSTVCERVQVGTEMVEQPIYEIRCK